jgi:DNA-binding transcriptional ArsR family regulator
MEPGEHSGIASEEPGIGRILHALGDPTRRAIVDMLSRRPHTVSQLAAPLGITLTAVAQHLQLLEESGLARTEKLGRVRTCSLDPQGFAALEGWVRDHRSAWEQRLDRLGEMLSEGE